MDSEAKAQILAEAIKNEKIRRAMLAGPCVSRPKRPWPRWTPRAR